MLRAQGRPRGRRCWRRHLSEARGGPDGDAVSGFAARYGFDRGLVEEVAWLVRITEYLAEGLGGCVVRGGMGVVFNLHGAAPRRLSRDTDVDTPATKEEVESVMAGLAGRYPQLRVRGPHKPRNPGKVLPLLTYYCKFDRIFPPYGTGEVKVEIFYGSRTDGGRTIRIPEYLGSIGPVFSVGVYEPEAIIGHKMTTLAFRTIGIPEGRQTAIPKHIYDITRMLGSPGGVRVDRMAGSLGRIIDDELSYLEDGAMGRDDVLADLDRFPAGLLDGRAKMGEGHRGRLSAFAAGMLGTRYTMSEHLADILLVKAALVLSLDIVRGADAAGAQASLDGLLAGLGRLSGLSMAEKGTKHRKITREAREAGADASVMSNLNPEQAYVYRWLAARKQTGWG